MNKARRKNNKRGVTRRLVRESLILSTTRFVSSRAVRFFQTGMASPFLTSVKKVDRFARDKVTGPLFKKIELRKNFSMPARNAVAMFFSRNPIIKGMLSLQTAVLNSSLRSMGIFLLTFGIYASAIVLLKRFVNLAVGDPSGDDLIVSALAAVAGILLSAFGDKSNIAALGNGRIIGSLLTGVLGVNNSSLNKIPPKRAKTSIGVSFLLGSVLGVLTMFFTPLSVLLSLLALAVFAAILNIPEFGLLLSVASFAVLPVKWVYTIAFATLASYFLKCLRLKRNFRFGTSDAMVLLLFVSLSIYCAASGRTMFAGEHYLLCFVLLYFAAKNLICSERLLMQTFNALSTGVFLGMVVYVIGEFASVIPHAQVGALANIISLHKLGSDMLSVAVSAVLPFVFSSFSSKSTGRCDIMFIVLAAVCAFISDSFLFYVMVAAPLFVYIAFSYKAPFGSLLSAAVWLPPILIIAYDFSQSTAVTAFINKAVDASLMSPDFLTATFWDGFKIIGGAWSFIILAIAVALILQRVLAATLLLKSEKTTLVCGTVAASAVILLAETLMFNLLSDLRLVLLMFVVLGMCGSVYKIYYGNNEEV